MRTTRPGNPAPLAQQPSTAPAEVQARLEEQWRRRVNEISDLMVHLHDLRSHIGRASEDSVALDIEVEIIEAQVAAARRGLDEAEFALARLREGRYGVCERCGEAIASERLEVLPEARLCTPCQSRQPSRR